MDFGETERNGERTLEQIEADIERTKAELKAVKGSETEVYARIVGYYRAVRNWNKGKRDEYGQRRLFSMSQDMNETASLSDEMERSVREASRIAGEGYVPALEEPSPAPHAEGAASYELFFRTACPNCPPVKQFLSQSSLPGQSVDVDTESGLDRAASQGVFSTPTAILRTAGGAELGRAHTVEELRALLEPRKEAVIA